MKTLKGAIIIGILSLAFIVAGCDQLGMQGGIDGQFASGGVFKAASKAVATYGALQVKGTQICAADGTPVQLRGMSMFWSQWSTPFWNATLVKNMAETWNSTIIRAAMGVESGGYLTNPETEKQRVKTIVDAAVANGIYVIVDWHDHNADLNVAAAKAFFKEMAGLYKDTPNVIFEVFNEPTNQSWATVKAYALQVIAEIRNAGANNIVVVGSPTWSQDVDLAAADPITGYSNVAYTLHFYAGSHSGGLRSKAETAMSKGLAIFVTEYGTCDASGNGGYNAAESQVWCDWMDKYKISSCNWSANDKTETASAFVNGASTTGPWTDAMLTDSGKFARGYILKGGAVPVDPVVPVDLPGTVEAETWSAMSGVQTESCSEGGLNVGWIDAGDWIDYAVNPATAGSYAVEVRVASAQSSGAFALQKDGANLASFTVPSTGSWQTWTSLKATVTLAAGKQTLRLAATGAGFNVNWIKFASGGEDPTTYSSLPGTVEAEAWSAMSGVQTESCSEGGLNVGWIDAGDWIDYAVNPATAGSYAVEVRVASAQSSGAFALQKDGANLASFTVPSTGSWQTWTSLKATVTLAAGKQTLRLAATGAGFNVNWIGFATGDAPPVLPTIALNAWQASGDSGGLNIWNGGVGSWDPGEWIRFDKVDLQTGYKYLSLEYCSTTDSVYEVRIDSATGTTIATLNLASTGSWSAWKTLSAALSPATGVHSIYIRCVSGYLNAAAIKIYN